MNVRHFTILIIAAAAVLLSGCRGPKLATANEQMARGEYFDASRTYRKVYNKLTKRKSVRSAAKSRSKWLNATSV